MSRGGRFWPVAVVLVITLSLEVAPLPGPMEYWRAPWVALAVIYWSMALPHRVNIRLRSLLLLPVFATKCPQNPTPPH